MAIDFLREQVARHGDVVPWAVLNEGFAAGGERVRLIGPQGILKPKQMELPLSIATSPNSPYDDGMDTHDRLLYRYRASDPDYRDNRGLHRLMELGAPLVYLKGIVKGKYLATWPVFVVAANPLDLTFTVSIEHCEQLPSHFGADRVADARLDSETAYRRAYAKRLFPQRLHQSSFRERVLRAYREQCAVCRLRHQELLDAAHILPDSDENSMPTVSNGLALCKLHHAAFDRHFLAVRDDYIVEVRPDILGETDGPMLVHGLQQLHGSRIALPRATELRPDRDLLSHRYELFRAAG